MSDTTAQGEQLLSALYTAASALLVAVTDPLALQDAPLRHRAAALNAVSSLIGRLQKVNPAPARPNHTRFEWDFGPREDDADSDPATRPIDPYFALDASPQPDPAALDASPEQELIAVTASAGAGHSRTTTLHGPQPAPDRAFSVPLSYTGPNDSRAPHQLSARPSHTPDLIPNPARN